MGHKARQTMTAHASGFVAWYDFSRWHEILLGWIPIKASGLANEAWTIKQLLEDAANA